MLAEDGLREPERERRNRKRRRGTVRLKMNNNNNNKDTGEMLEREGVHSLDNMADVMLSKE